MPIIKYNQKDIVPIILNVLSVSTRFYLSTAFKFALKYHYQDLQGKVDTNDDLDQESIMLLESLDDEIIAMMIAGVKAFLQAYSDIRYIYFDQSGEEELNERQMELALEFYAELIIDHFPGNTPKLLPHDIDENDYKKNLLVYIESLISIVHMLHELMLCAQLDTEEAIRVFGKRKKWFPGNGGDELLAGVLRVLQELAETLYQHNFEYTRYYLREK